MKKFTSLTSIYFVILATMHTSLWAQECTDREHITFKKYDAYLDKNPDILDDQARAIFAKRVRMRPTALKELYFRCLGRWRTQEPKAAEQLARDSLQSMAARGESPLTKGHNCNMLGFRYGHTATSTALQKKPT